ncbi:MAG: hypothetical protein Q9216_001720 [Gyalolechia sp. 2 TL-2023]
MATMSEEKAAMARARLKQHFNVPAAEHEDRWVDLWNAGDFLPWDRQLPSPALNDLLDQRKDLIGSCFIEDDSSTGTKRRKKALVPGCGAGYDVLLLASYGYDAYGLEVSEKAVQRCVEEQKTNGHKYPVKDEASGAGSCTFLKGDFFDTAWSKEMTAEGTFEFVYDYTVCCFDLLPIRSFHLFGTSDVVNAQRLMSGGTVLLRSRCIEASSLGVEDVTAPVKET